MKEKNIFDKIYQKELDLNFNNLNYTKTANQETPKNDLSEEADLKKVSDESLDAFLNSFYNSKDLNEVKIPTAFEKKILTEKVLRNRVKAQNIREEIEDLKSRIKERVDNKTYVLDISRSTTLKKAANNIFGGNKKNITYDDYIALLEMKEQIIVNESMDIMED